MDLKKKTFLKKKRRRKRRRILTIKQKKMEIEWILSGVWSLITHEIVIYEAARDEMGNKKEINPLLSLVLAYGSYQHAKD